MSQIDNMTLPPEQKAIHAKCFHPTEIYVEFSIEDVEISIPARFEKIVRQHADRIAVKTIDEEVTYSQLNDSQKQRLKLPPEQHAIPDKRSAELEEDKGPAS